MFTITIQIATATWAYYFREPSACDKAFNALGKAKASGERDFRLEDDYGQVLNVDTNAIVAFQKASAERGFEPQLVVELLRQRAQAKFVTMANNDPTLSFLAGVASASTSQGKIIRPNGAGAS